MSKFCHLLHFLPNYTFMQNFIALNYIMKHVTLYTDGACSGNPGPGGYGVILLYNNHRKEISQGFRRTTNNRMELHAVIAGLEQLKEKCHVTLYTDSRYIADAITKGWVKKWKNQAWMRNQKERALNADLWDRMLTLMDTHTVSIIWVRGHSGNIENERCDKLAVAAADGDHLIEDIIV
jgi:ribonuclease HI